MHTAMYWPMTCTPIRLMVRLNFSDVSRVSDVRHQSGKCLGSILVRCQGGQRDCNREEIIELQVHEVDEHGSIGVAAQVWQHRYGSSDTFGGTDDSMSS